MSEKSGGLLGFAKGAGLVVGGIAGLLSATTAIGVAAEKYAIGRIRSGEDPHADEPFGRLRSDRDYTVIAADGVPLHVEEVGDLDAPLVVVFVHGFSLDMGCWHFQRSDLADLRHPRIRMVFFDQRSHGRSGRSDPDSCTIDQLGSDLHDVIRTAAHDEPVVLVGHSMGGMAIMGLAAVEAAMFDRQVVGVVLVSTSAGNLLTSSRTRLGRNLTPRVLPWLARGAQASPKLVESGRKVVADAVWLGVRRFSFGSESNVGATLTDYVDRMIAATPADVLGDFYATLAGHDKVAALPALNRTEVLIICGTEDKLTPTDHSDVLAEAIHDVDVLQVEGAGHLVMMERSDIVEFRLRGFLHHVVEVEAEKGRRLA